MIEVAAKQGPKFIQYFQLVLDALRQLDGSGRPAEIVDLISSNYQFNESEYELLSDGTPRFSKNINWARFYLAKAGYIDGSTRGVWSLTELGWNASFSHEDALALFDTVYSQISKSQTKPTSDDAKVVSSEQDEMLDAYDHRKRVLNLLRDLPPSGFERLTQRLLREAGFERVVVNGRSGDGGIDGQGILRINPFVSFQVCFQCKRYSGTVGSGYVRDFRGSIMGRADKGIMITTGAFSADARREAIRDGATQIELVDSEQLVDMLEQLELGLIKKHVYDIDIDFFQEFVE